MKTADDIKTDKALRRDVLDELASDASVDASHIGVTAHQGVVTFSGHVPTHADVHAAETAAKRVHGVRAIANEIEVKPSARHQRDDEQIAMAAVHALEWDAKASKNRVQVVVSDGWVTLDGTADHRFEKEAAERAIRHLIGVRGVTNRIVVEPAKSEVAQRMAIGQIKTNIDSALRRSAIINPREVDVEVIDYTAILSGDVRSHAERDEVERIAWLARGITQVENCITITPWGSGPSEEWGY